MAKLVTSSTVSKNKRPGRITAEKRRAAIADVKRDLDALEDIHQLLDGTEWDTDTLLSIADIIRETGREIRDPE
jgi:hypothetical protein